MYIQVWAFLAINFVTLGKLLSGFLSLRYLNLGQPTIRIMALEKTLESALDRKENKPVNPKANQPQIFIRRTDAEALIHWPPDVKSQLFGKDSDAGKD